MVDRDIVMNTFTLIAGHHVTSTKRATRDVDSGTSSQYNCPKQGTVSSSILQQSHNCSLS